LKINRGDAGVGRQDLSFKVYQKRTDEKTGGGGQREEKKKKRGGRIIAWV